MKSEDEKYNGWTNYETWNVALHMSNDLSSQEYWRDRTVHHYTHCPPASKTFTREENAALQYMDELKDYHEDAKPELQGTYGDLLDAALSQVNWYEIAMNLIDDLDKGEINDENATDE